MKLSSYVINLNACKKILVEINNTSCTSLKYGGRGRSGIIYGSFPHWVEHVIVMIEKLEIIMSFLVWNI